MMTKSELLKGRDRKYPDEYTKRVSDNLDRLIDVMNHIRMIYSGTFVCTSGWRPAEVNANTPGASDHSKHMQGLACDIADPDGKLMAWVLKNLELMQMLGLYFEDFRWTPGWCHFQLGPPASGHRIFIPSSTRPQSPKRWDGVYDKTYDIAA